MSGGALQARGGQAEYQVLILSWDGAVGDRFSRSEERREFIGGP